jgi:hypothetical protein
MTSPPSDRLSGRRLRDAPFAVGVVAGVLSVVGFLGYGDFVATLPGIVVLVLVGSLGFRASRAAR